MAGTGASLQQCRTITEQDVIAVLHSDVNHFSLNGGNLKLMFYENSEDIIMFFSISLCPIYFFSAGDRLLIFPEFSTGKTTSILALTRMCLHPLQEMIKMAVVD